MRRWIDITKHRPNPLPGERVNGRRKRKRRHDYLALKAQRTDRKLQPNRRIANRNAVLHIEILGDLRFELAQVHAVVRQPTPIENIVKAGQHLLAVAEIRTTNVQRIRK
jgi:hypothetical protein